MKAVLAYVKYKDIRGRTRKIDGIHPIEKNENPYYPKFVEVGDFDFNQSSPTFLIQEHMYVYIPEYESRHTASLVFIASENEHIDIIESGTENGNATKWERYKTMFYCPAKFKGKTDKSEDDFDSDIPNEVTSAGLWAIKIYHSDGKQFIVNVKVLPSISEENYQLMLKDLVKVHQDLVFNARGSVGFNSKWDHIYQDIEKEISDMSIAVSQIMESPKTNLFQEYSKQNVNKIKNFSPRSIQDAFIKGQQSVNAISYSEDYNIYEHRAIKLFLCQMKRLCEQCMIIAENEKKQSVDELIQSCVDHAENRDLLDRVSRNEELIEDLFNRRWNRLQSSCPVDVSVKFSVTNSILDCIYDDSTHVFGLFPVLVQDDNGRYFAEPIKADIRDYGTYKFDFVGVNILYTSLEDLLFFCDCIQTIKKCKSRKIEISGRCIQEPKTEKVNSDYPSYSFVFSNIDSITIDGVEKRFSDFDINRTITHSETLKTLKNDLLCDAWRDDKVRFEMEVAQKRNYIKNLNCEKGTLERFEHIKSSIDKLINSHLLQGLKPGNNIHVTPIFQRDSRYHKAFIIMKRYRQQLKTIDLSDTSRYPIRKTCDIYEYWCYIKMLSVFITEYSFDILQIGNIKNGTVLALAEDIRSYIIKGSYKGTYVSLHHKDLDLYVDIIFNGSLDRIDKPESPYCPDYQLIIKKGKSVLHFCMDAKYRNYNVQRAEWRNDLIEVAKTKYIDNSKDFINGSYILHSDSNHKPFYAGNKSIIDQNTGGISENESYVCRIGSIDLLPQNTKHFKTLLQMIFEFFIGGETGYRKKCWICGSDNVIVKCLQTSGGFPKYHMTCKNPACNAFWVENHCSETICHHREFGKHLNNYLEESIAGNCWLVKCPICEHDGQSYLNAPSESFEDESPYEIFTAIQDYSFYEEPPPLSDDELLRRAPFEMIPDFKEEVDDLPF